MSKTINGNSNANEKDFSTSSRSKSILERTTSGSIGAVRTSTSSNTGANVSSKDNATSHSRPSSSLRSSYRTGSTLGLKRDSVQAELEDNLLQSKRQLSTTLSTASLERELATAKTRLGSYQKSISEKETYISQLEQDRRYLSDLNQSLTSAHEEASKKLEEDLKTMRERVKALRDEKAREEREKEEWKEKWEVGERERRKGAGTIEGLKGELEVWKNRSQYLEKEVEELRKKERERQRQLEREEDERELSMHSVSSSSLDPNAVPPGEHTLNAEEVYRTELTHQASSLRSLESTITKLGADLAIQKMENQTLKERYGDSPGLWKEIGILREENRSLEVKLKRKEEDVERLIREGERTVLEMSTNSFRSSVRGGSVRSTATPGPNHGDIGMVTPAPTRTAPFTNNASTSKRNIITPTTMRTQPGSLMSRSMRSKKGRSLAETPLKSRGSGFGSVLNEPKEGQGQRADEMSLDELTTSTPRGHVGVGGVPASTSAFGSSSVFGSGFGSGSSSEMGLGMGTSLSMGSVLEENEGEDRDGEVDELQSSGLGEDLYERGNSEAPLEDDEIYEDPPSIHTTADLLALRLEHAKLVDEHGETKAELQGMKRKCERLEGELKELRESVGEDDMELDGGKGKSRMRDENLALKMRVRTVEDEIKGAKRELAFANQVLDKYQADEKAKRTAGSSSTPPLDEVTSARLSQLSQLESMYEDSKSTNTTLRSQIEALQSKLEKARADLQALTQENAQITHRLSSYESASSPTLQSLQDTLNAERTAKETAQSALGNAQKEIEDHLKKIEDLEQQLFELGGEIAGGRHVPPNVRVMQMPDNPADKYFDARRSVMDAVRKQNEGLMKRIEELEQRLKQSGGSVGSGTDAGAGDGGTDDSESLVPRSSLDAYITQNEDLTFRLDQSEKRYKRLMDIFSDKTAEFKACLSTVLGVKIAWSKNGDIRVTSMFDLSTQLQFKPVNREKWKPGEMKPYVLSAISEGAGLQGLDEMINYWVREQNCVPALVASVTMECYEKMKREGRDRGELEMFITADPIH